MGSPETCPCPDGDACPDARRYGKIHPAPATPPAPAASAVTRAEYDALVAERDALRGRVEEAEAVVIALRSLHAEDGRVDAEFSGEFVKAFSTGLVQMYRDSGAKNYLDIKFVDRTTGETYTVTVQRDLGKTAHTLRTEAESARDAATARAERAERERDDAHRASMTAAEDFANATGRVSKSNVELRALLGDVRDTVTRFLRLLGKAHEVVMPSCRGNAALSAREKRVKADLARIDALLDTPTDDDTRGDGRDEGGRE